jgi:hypothetical protein
VKPWNTLYLSHNNPPSEDQLFVRKRAENPEHDRILGYIPLDATDEYLIRAFFSEMPGTFDLCRVNANGQPNYDTRDVTVHIRESHPALNSFEAFVDQLR